MLKISNKKIIDVVHYDNNKFIIVEKHPIVNSLNQFRAKYFVINFDSGQKEVITKSAYLMVKFGSAYKEISSTIADFIQCDAAVLPNRNILVVYPNSQTGLFSHDGKIKWTGELKYNDSIVAGLALDGDYFWSYCKEENCVIRYICDNLKVDLRIGSKQAMTFVNPHSISEDDSYIYVCCDAMRVRKISKKDFTVSDVDETFINLERFYKFGEYSIVCCSDGAYLTKDSK